MRISRFGKPIDFAQDLKEQMIPQFWLLAGKLRPFHFVIESDFPDISESLAGAIQSGDDWQSS